MERLTEYEARERFDEWLDETEEPHIIFGMTYLPSTILKECDPIAYRVAFFDWVDYENREGDLSVEGYHEEEEDEEGGDI